MEKEEDNKVENIFLIVRMGNFLVLKISKVVLESVVIFEGVCFLTFSDLRLILGFWILRGHFLVLKIPKVVLE